MNLPSARAWAALLPLALGVAAAQSAHGAEGKYPYKPIRIIQGFSIGGISDTLARIVGDKLGEHLGQPVVVEARSGAGGIVGMTVVSQATPDGYTLLIGNSVMTISPNMKQKPPFDPIKTFTPVSMIGNAPSILLANAATPVNSLADLIAYAKARPGNVNSATSGVGTSNDLAVRLFNYMAGIEIITVPYKGSGPALTAVLGNETPISFGPLLPAIPQVRAGKLKALGLTGSKRSPALPDVPTMAESLPGYEVVGWYSIVAPARTPVAIVQRLHTEINAVLVLPEIQKRLTDQGLDVEIMSIPQFAEFIRKDAARWAELVKKTGLAL
ncbi:MAG: tripartite tricarboxylate transporter substrate binding protein [Betaproteobacteria bacterium]|nr:tripartite tricarboxylate transporter substrate binding protein [Betaproteobacteria bacterium]